MAIPKKGSRKIIVTGVIYRWYIRKKPSYGQALSESNLTAVVELFENPVSLLTIDFNCFRNDSWIDPGNRNVKPSHISEGIKMALIEGWLPSSPKPHTQNFILEEYL